MGGGHSTNDCNACSAAPGSKLECDFDMGVSTHHTYTTDFSSATGVTVGMGIKFQAGIVFAKAGTTFSVSVSETLTTGHSTSDDKSYSTNSACKATINGGSRESAKATFFEGTLIGDFTADVTTKFDCSWKKDQTQ